MSAAAVMLSLKRVRRDFGQLRAVDGVSFDVGAGQVVGVMGPNGSGKTTLLNVISGLYRPSDGTVTLQGTRIDGLPRDTIARRGVARTFQKPRTFDSLSAIEHCVAASAEPDRRSGAATPLVLFLKPWRTERGKAAAALRDVFGDAVPQGLARALPHGRRRLLELARSLAADPQLLLLDEPTSGLNDEETAALAVVLSTALSKRRLTAIIVDHKFEFLRAVCSRIVVMENGRVIADGTSAEIAGNTDVIDAYFGTEAA